MTAIQCSDSIADTGMLWLKAFHIIFVVTWFAGLFYLPRLFVYHAEAGEAVVRDRLKVMERRLLGITHIGGALAVVFGLATVAFGLTAFAPPRIGMDLALVAMLVWGSADMFSVYVRSSLIQIHTPDEMRGRVSSVSMLTISASNELGEAESGFLAALIGPVAAVIAGGAGAVIITLVWARLFPELGRARTFDPPEQRAADTV